MYFQTFSSIVARQDEKARALSFGRIRHDAYAGQGLREVFAVLRATAAKFLRVF